MDLGIQSMPNGSVHSLQHWRKLASMLWNTILPDSHGILRCVDCCLYSNIVPINLQGVTIAEYKAKSAKPPTAAGAPPPPPPPPPPAAPPASTGSPAPTGGAAAVFADINRGADVTKGLRKVDKSEMTHKNPNLRASSVVPTSSGSRTHGLCPLIIISHFCHSRSQEAFETDQTSSVDEQEAS